MSEVTEILKLIMILDIRHSEILVTTSTEDAQFMALQKCASLLQSHVVIDKETAGLSHKALKGMAVLRHCERSVEDGYQSLGLELSRLQEQKT